MDELPTLFLLKSFMWALAGMSRFTLTDHLENRNTIPFVFNLFKIKVEFFIVIQ